MKLSKVFATVEPEFVLGTTYTLSLAFFESVVFPHIKRQHLRRCLLLCDPHGLEMAMSEAPALQYAARDYMVATAPSAGTFHAKVWVLLSKRELLLLVGSGNLTQPGFIENVEIFDVVRLDAGTVGRELAEDVLGFMRGLAGLWRGTSDPNLLAVQTLREMIGAVGDLAANLATSAEPLLRFLSSFGGAFPTQLAALRPDTAYVAAPYFGNSTEGLRLLHSTLGAQRTFVFPALHKDGKLDLPVREASKLRGVKVQSLSLAAANPKKFAHLKLYGLRNSQRHAWLFTSSVNCTLAAMEGPNVEAGLLRRVTENDLASYFEGTALACGESASHFSTRPPKAGWVIMWATDVGDQISIETAPAARARLPLVDVKVELRTAQRTAFIELPRAFARAGTERVAWRHFGDFRSQLRNAAVLRITATDANGLAVTGQCLVDDFAALTSDPVHRSAWRAAVAMLGAEGMPDYADVAALFSLAEVTTVDDEEGEIEAVPQAARLIAGSTKETKREKAAIWPPTPLLEDSIPTGPYGHGAGNIYWFNRILAAFLSRTEHDPGTAGDAAQIVDAGDDEGMDTGGQTQTEIAPETGDDLARAARRLWEQASDALDRMRSRLNALEVTKASAHRIWGPATLVFLGVLHIASAIRSKEGLRDSVPSTTSLVRTWLAMILTDRDQGKDYKSNPSSAHKGRFFPSLVWDLCSRFGEAPHPEVLAIICVAFAHARASRIDRRGPIPIVEWFVLRHLTGDLLDAAFLEKAHLEHVWKAYFQDKSDAVTWPQMQQTIDELHRTTWMDHPGFRDMVILEGVKTGKEADGTAALSESLRGRLGMFRLGGCKSVEASRYDDACWNPNCPIYGTETSEMQLLKDLRPVICPCCGRLYVPDRLAEMFRRSTNG